MSLEKSFFVFAIILGLFCFFVGIWVEHSTMKGWPFSRYSWRIRELEAEIADLKNELRRAGERY